ncbi:unnamed protein product [Arctogadus glacialis]
MEIRGADRDPSMEDGGRGEEDEEEVVEEEDEEEEEEEEEEEDDDEEEMAATSVVNHRLSPKPPLAFMSVRVFTGRAEGRSLEL